MATNQPNPRLTPDELRLVHLVYECALQVDPRGDFYKSRLQLAEGTLSYMTEVLGLEVTLDTVLGVIALESQMIRAVRS